MESRECLYREQFGYCWMQDGQWFFQPVDVHEAPLGEPMPVALADLVFRHDQDEELH